MAEGVFGGFLQGQAATQARQQFPLEQQLRQLRNQQVQQGLEQSAAEFPLQQQLLQQRIAQQQAAFPIQQQLDQLRLQESQLGLQRTQQQIATSERERKAADLTTLGNIFEAVEAENISDPSERYQVIKNMATRVGLGDAVSPGDESQRNMSTVINAKNSLASRGLGLSAGEREFDMLTEGLSERDKEIARRIKLGLAPRAVGSASQTIAETGKTGAVAASEAEIAGAKKEAGLTAELKLKPEIEKAVATSVASAKADADAIANQKSDDAAFNLYQTAFSGLSSALGQTTTGPFFGLMPAVTSKQQIADGAIAAVAPILKQMFRAAGEGTFTDSDQKILLDMIPTRKDKPDAREAKLLNIDAIVRSKLKQAEGGGRRFKYNPATREFE